MKKRVLVVDDIEYVRSTLSEALTEEGFEVIDTADDGLSAIHKSIELKPDFITMDLIMPRVGGIDAIKKIKEHLPHCKIIAVTTIDQVELLLEAIHAGASEYILKPFHLKSLTEAFDRAENGIQPEAYEVKEFLQSIA